MSARTTASLKKVLTNRTSGFFASAPTITVFWIFSLVLVVLATLKPLPRSDRPTSAGETLAVAAVVDLTVTWLDLSWPLATVCVTQGSGGAAGTVWMTLL